MVKYSFLSPLEGLFEAEIPLLQSAKTIQILVIRQTHDYTIFRTEDTRELNVATLPKSIDNPEAVLKAVMLASKQKAPENRMYIRLYRSYANALGVELEDAVKNCRLKDNLCRRCPRCVLFGAVSTETGQENRWNIKHRIEYNSAYSIESYDEISELITFNAVDIATQSTGQALNVTENIRPIAHFPSVVTLKSITEEELIFYLKTLMATKSYGAETRVKGDMINVIAGIAGGFEEVITSLEYNLELSSRSGWIEDPITVTEEILKKYRSLASMPDQVRILSKKEMEELIKAIRDFTPSKDFIERLGEHARKFAEKADEVAGGGKGKRGGRRS